MAKKISELFTRSAVPRISIAGCLKRAPTKAMFYLRALPPFLFDYYSQDQLAIFKKIRDGFLYFSTGLVSIYLANVSMEPSIWQELITLLGIVLCTLGFIIAMLSYVRFVISRFVIFFNRQKIENRK